VASILAALGNVELATDTQRHSHSLRLLPREKVAEHAH
jgi:hypothetical protein